MDNSLLKLQGSAETFFLFQNYDLRTWGLENLSVVIFGG